MQRSSNGGSVSATDTSAPTTANEPSCVAVVVQSDLVSEAGYPSTIVLPTTTRLADTDAPLRLRLPAGTAGLDRDSDVLVGQLIAVANESFAKELGVLPPELLQNLEEKLRWVLAM